MGRKKKAKKVVKPFCYYCDRKFEDEAVLLQHQRAKHFKCHECHKKMGSAHGLNIHVSHVHKGTLSKVPNAKEGRDGFELDIQGMQGVPEDCIPGDELPDKEDSKPVLPTPPPVAPVAAPVAAALPVPPPVAPVPAPMGMPPHGGPPPHGHMPGMPPPQYGRPLYPPPYGPPPPMHGQPPMPYGPPPPGRYPYPMGGMPPPPQHHPHYNMPPHHFPPGPPAHMHQPPMHHGPPPPTNLPPPPQPLFPVQQSQQQSQPVGTDFKPLGGQAAAAAFPDLNAADAKEGKVVFVYKDEESMEEKRAKLDKYRVKNVQDLSRLSDSVAERFHKLKPELQAFQS